MKAIRLLSAMVLACAALLGPGAALAQGRTISDPDAAPRAPSLALTLPPPYLSDANAADAPFGNSPTLDGLISPGEYAGAGKVTFPSYGGTVEVFFREDSSYLYIAFDFPHPQTPGSAAQVFLDTNHDRATLPQTDDYRLSIDQTGTARERRGTGESWGSHTAPVSWSAKTALTLGGWQAEFRIEYSKLGVTAGAPKVLGLALINAWTPTWDHYWPQNGFWTNPSTWGHLTSSSEWGTFYWKPGPWEDYAPSGLPDFDQLQVLPTWCGPFAAANSLWWFDSKFEPNPAGPTGSPVPTLPISDHYTLVTPYGPWDDHDPQNVLPLVTDLAANYFGTDRTAPGTRIYDVYSGTQRYLRDHGLWDDYVVTLVNKPDFPWIAEEVMRSEDVILLLGFWQLLPFGGWSRVGGHYVTVAGVDMAGRIALSDPALDHAEMGRMGRVLSGTLIAHTPIPHLGQPTLHNDAGNVSHDIYTVLPESPSPGGSWWIDDYEPPLELLMQSGANPNPRWEEPGTYMPAIPVHVEIEYALAVSPFDWKASGRWVEDATVPLYGQRFAPYHDFAPSGMPDFDQKQDSWQSLQQPPPRWSFCGPVAAANSLWWFDSKFEAHGAVPPTIRGTYPMVWPYGPWDDHDPLNVDNPISPWPPPGWPSVLPPIAPGSGEFVEDLALYFRTDMLGAGTVVTDVAQGIAQYVTDHGLRQGYVITQVQRPPFWWLAEEVEISEDVILLLGFYRDTPEPERIGGHYVTVAGVDKQGGYVGFSDPYWDRMEERLPPNEFTGIPLWSGRIGSDGDPLLGPSGLVPNYTHSIPHAAITILHNDAANVSHDVYWASASTGPGGVWGPANYATSTLLIENFYGMNGPGVAPPGAVPVHTEVEWAVAVSPVADVAIAKHVTPTVVENNERITFTLIFSNAGSLPAEGVVITDRIPTQVTSLAWSTWVSNGGSITVRPGPPYTWDVPDLAWNEWGIITVTGRISDTSPIRVVTNSVAISTSSIEQYQVPALANSAQATFTIRNRRTYLPLIIRAFSGP